MPWPRQDDRASRLIYLMVQVRKALVAGDAVRIGFARDAALWNGRRHLHRFLSSRFPEVA